MSTFKAVDRIAQGNRLLGRAEVLARLGISERTLKRLRARHDFPAPLKLPTGKFVYLEAEVDAFIQSLLDARAREASTIKRF